MDLGQEIFCYRDFRLFLRKAYAHKKETEHGFSLRAFSNRAGLGSSNYLKLVMDGDRNLTPRMASRFADALGLTGDSERYFCDLVAFNQANDSHERARAFARLRRFRAYREIHQLDEAQEAYYSSWFIPAIRELCVLPCLRGDARWIGKLLLPSVPTRQVRRAIGVLLDLGLIARGSDGIFKQAQPVVDTANRPLSHYVYTFHREMIRKALEALDSMARDQREIASVTLVVSPEDFAEIRERLVAFRRELLDRFQNQVDDCRVVQVNFQMFPLTKPVKSLESSRIPELGGAT